MFKEIGHCEAFNHLCLGEDKDKFKEASYRLEKFKNRMQRLATRHNLSTTYPAHRGLTSR